MSFLETLGLVYGKQIKIVHWVVSELSSFFRTIPGVEIHDNLKINNKLIRLIVVYLNLIDKVFLVKIWGNHHDQEPYGVLESGGVREVGGV